MEGRTRTGNCAGRFDGKHRTAGTLVFLPRALPAVGSKVNLTVTENAEEEVSVTAQVIRLERNASHPQAAFQLTDSLRLWKKKVWEYAGEILAAEKPEDFDDY